MSDVAATRFKSKVVEIEAWCNSEEPDVRSATPDWLSRAYADKTAWYEQGYHPPIYIRTLEGVMTASYGDWIICGTEGEIYPCKNSVFQRKYEPVAPPKAAKP